MTLRLRLAKARAKLAQPKVIAGTKLLARSFVASGLGAITQSLQNGISNRTLAWSGISGGVVAAVSIIEEWLRPGQTKFGIGSDKTGS